MSLKDLTYNILSGNLNEAVESFKSVMAEKTLQKIEEKKKGRYDKDLDKNHNGKLDADDFKILRGEKDHKCTAACEETELDEAQSMGGALRNSLSKPEPGSKLDKNIKHHNSMVKQFGADAGTIDKAPEGHYFDKKGMIKLAKEETELEAQLSEVLDPSQGVKAYIDDFQKSDDPRFTGKSKEKRRQMAIAAFYAAKKK